MSDVRSDLRAFLADPAAFAAALPDWQREAWRAGLRFAESVLPSARPLRDAQHRAWQDSVGQRVALILGPPGTGKTYLLAWMVTGFADALRETGRPCRVLFTGFTRESIGNLFDDFMPLARAHLPGAVTVFLGNAPDQPLPVGVRSVPLLDAEDLDDARNLFGMPLLMAAATGWSLYKLFANGAAPGGNGPTAPIFDLVVVDEASQLTLAQGLLGLSGLASGGRVVVAGDDRQLPPVRAGTDATAADGRNLGGSLYAFLKSGRAPEYRLTETFRLNAPLAEPPARLFYDGEYTSAVPHRRLDLRRDWAAGLPDWVRLALDPEHPLCVLIHDGPPCGTDNPFEQTILRELVVAFAERLPPEPGQTALSPEYLWGERLAVVTPHRAQNAALRDVLAGHASGAGAVVETVDRIQGRERDVILAGYTVSDPEFAAAEAEFLFSPERLNVTVTRPRAKLVLIVSRRLLEVTPTDEGTFDAAFTLREYAFDTDFVLQVELPFSGGSVPVEIRIRRFTAPAPKPLSTSVPTVSSEPAPMPPPALLPAQAQLLDAIREVVNTSDWDAAGAWDVDKHLGRKTKPEEYRTLVEAGKLSAVQRTSKEKGTTFLVWRPRDADVVPFPCTPAAVRANLEAVLEVARPIDGPAWYDRVRDRFLWFDWRGTDLLEPLLRALVKVDPGYRFSEDGKQFDRADVFTATALPVLPEPPDADLSDDDFRVLNALETEEARRINFGAFETAITPAWLARDRARPLDEVRAALGRLAAHHYLMWVDDTTVRSRMSELAREVRYVKQRFGPDDADRRPYMIRAVQVRTVPRTKPTRDQKLAPAIVRLKTVLAKVPHAAPVLDALHAMLRTEWGDPVSVAGFQLRAIERLLPAYLGVVKEDTFVITADTGSGKTEAALLPLIAGAAIDRFSNRRGVKTVLAYPRIRLAYNQAQRLVKYLSLFAAQPGGTKLTVGVQSKDIPFYSHAPATYQANNQLEPWPGDTNTGFEFSLFGCPACGKNLRMRPEGGTDGHDRLTCTECKWAFDGWAGSKTRVQQQPPDFFMPVTESLHQWQHEPYAGKLFGDRPDFFPPRALLADEIHLYSHIQGAQIGYTLRRLLARCELNARPKDARPARPLAVGMSATLGDPSAVWGQLTDRTDVPEITPRRKLGPNNEPTELQENPRAREYFYFVQPEVESRGKSVAGAAATIQTLMCLAHGMRRRPGERGGYRGLVFFDSIDSLKQLHHDYISAEQQNKLAGFRTRRFPTNAATGRERPTCCGNPLECDVFGAGECWYFAAAAAGANPVRTNDPYQVAAGPDGDPVGQTPGRALTVMDRPVYSGTGGKVDELMRRSDLVFSTSSLEVGFDDPDMILVYQHYAPANLASFAQRKGRGGRGADDRPVTGCTLSIYSAKDNWYFRHPDLLLQSNSFDVPLNPDNFFVRRGQAVAALLDAVARVCCRENLKMPTPGADALAGVGELVGRADARLLSLALGETVLSELKVKTLTELWTLLCESRDTRMFEQESWRQLLPWVPERLFDAINLPLLRVTYPRDNGAEQTEQLDVSLAFGYCAPGNATRRFGHAIVHWVLPPVAELAPMFPSDQAQMLDADLVSSAERVKIGNSPEALDRYIRAGLPDEVVARLPEKRLLYHHMFRPESVRLTELGRFVPDQQTRRSVWQPMHYWSPTDRRILTPDPANVPGGLRPIHHKTGSELLGFPLVSQTSPGKKSPVRGLQRLALDITGFTGGPHGQTDTGLRVHRTYWGTDVTLRLGESGTEEENWTVTFSDQQGDQPALYGYQIDTEGVRLTPDGKHLSAFVAAEIVAINQDEARSRWHRGQFFRYRLASGLAARGLNNSVAGPVAELLIAANGDTSLGKRLIKLRDQFDSAAFLQLLADAQRLRLTYHPLLTIERVRLLADQVRSEGFGQLLKVTLDALSDASAFAGYIRSLVLHGLLLSLHGLFVIHGRGDPRQVIGHAKLPIQFGTRADDHLTVFETGDHGDGTTRTFLRNVDRATAEWRRGELAMCPYAAEQALVDHFFERSDRHAHWRKLNPRHPDTLRTVARELTGTGAVPELLLQALGRLLYQSEAVGAQRFERYELYCEVRAVRSALASPAGQPSRRPAAWEVVSEAVRAAGSADARTPKLKGLLAAYRQLTPIQNDSLRPEVRLADQVYRLGVSVCVDGCRACLHQSSPLMADDLTPSAVSRELLQSYREFLLAPGTIRIDASQLPTVAQVREAVARDGFCRLAVNPAVNDTLAGRLAALGFPPGEYDPLLRCVVWLIEG